MVWGVFFPVILFMYINFVIFCIVKVYSLFLSYCLCLFSGQLEGRQLHFVFLFECRNIELITIADYKKKNVVFVCPLANVIVSFTEFYSVQIRII